MKFVLAIHGTRGDVEPCAAVGLELLRRGHEVRMAVPPNLVGFVESAGLAAVAYGPDSEEQLEDGFLPASCGRSGIRSTLVREGKELLTQGWAEMSTTLTSLADGADLLLTGQTLPGGRRQRRGVSTTFRWPRCITSRIRVNGQLHSDSCRRR